MKLGIFVVLAAGLVLAGLAWQDHGAAVARVKDLCMTAGVDEASCDCSAEKFAERVNFTSFLGVGDFRPLYNEGDVNEAAIEAGVICLAQIGTN